MKKHLPILLSVLLCASSLLAACARPTVPEVTEPPVTKSDIPYEYSLYDGEAAKLTVYSYIDAQDRCGKLTVKAELGDGVAHCSIKNIQINNELMLDDISCSAELQVASAEDLPKYVEYIGGWENVRSMTGTLLLEDAGYNEVLNEDVRIDFPDGLAPHIVTFPYRGLLADAQILCDDENVRIELLSLGSHSLEALRDDLEGELSFTNKSDHGIRVGLQGLILNGVYFPFNSEKCTLSPGESTLITFSEAPEEQILRDLAQITSVRAVILSSPDELLQKQSGGRNYPIVLNGSPQETKYEPTGTVLYEDEKIRLIKLKNTSGSLYQSLAYLSLENKTDQPFVFNCAVKTTDGKSDMDDIYADIDFVPAQSSAICRLSDLSGTEYANGDIVDFYLHISSASGTYTTDKISVQVGFAEPDTE